MSPARWQRVPSPRRHHLVGTVTAVLFVVTLAMFVEEPSWLGGLTAGVLLLGTLTSFGLARRTVTRGRTDRRRG